MMLALPMSQSFFSVLFFFNCETFGDGKRLKVCLGLNKKTHKPKKKKQLIVIYGTEHEMLGLRSG